MRVYVLPNFLSPAECAAAIAMFPKPETAAVNNIDGSAASVKRVRRGRAAFLPADYPERIALRDRIAAVITSANERHYRFDLGDCEAPQLAEYGVGDGYDWHLDIGGGSAALRKLSASVQLSDPSTYDGGDLDIWGTGRVERSQGAIILFPSYLPHRVTPVTRGERKSLVVWAIGEHPFR